MMIQIDWNPDGRELRKFGLTMLVALPLFGLLLSWKNGSFFALKVCWSIGIAVDFCAIFLPPVGRLLYKGWMGMAFVLAMVLSPVFMGAIYYLVFTPMGIILRLTGKDSMQRKKAGAESYWIKLDHKTDVRSYQRRF